ncbi:MAG: TIGR02594 family protein [Pseudolabrys sp.]|nr:TIGR02594 family protein [Pseudolabrys sp.]
MRLKTKRAAILAGAAVIAGLSAPASARPVHHHRHHHLHYRHLEKTRMTGTDVATTSAETNQRRLFERAEWAGRTGKRSVARRMRRNERATAAQTATPMFDAVTGNALVADARRYLGTNPTGRRTLWCGAFMDKILRDAGYPGGGNLALGYLHYGHRIPGPQVGAIAVMGRRHGGHVGVVSGVDANGNPIIISGNHNRTVAEAVYPRGRIIAYVMPGK